MSVIRSCTLAVILLMLGMSGCARALLGPAKLNSDSLVELKEASQIRPAESATKPSQLTSAPPTQLTSSPAESRPAMSAATLPARSHVTNHGSGAEGPRLTNLNDPAELAALERALNSPDSSLPPHYKEQLRDQLLAIAAGRDASLIHREPARTLPQQPAAAPVSHIALPGHQENSVVTASFSDRLNISHRLPQAAQKKTTSLPQESLPTAPAARVDQAAVTPTSGTVSSPAAADKGGSEKQSANSTEVQRGEWRSHLTKALESLETELKNHSTDDREGELLATSSRILHLVANHREQAVAAIDKLDEDEREYWKHQLHALLVAMDAEDKHAGGRRAALVLRELRAAADHLANVSALDVRNLAFCDKVDSYGTYSPFKSTSFKSGQSVVLYVEIDNFAVEQVGESFETELQAEYTIVDGASTRVHSKLPVVREECRNRRHDYFIAYTLVLPKDLPMGKYTLELVIEDVKGQKSSQATIDFSIR